MLIGPSGCPGQAIGFIKGTGLPLKTDKAIIRFGEVKKQSVSLLFYPSQFPRQYNGLGAVGDAELGRILATCFLTVFNVSTLLEQNCRNFAIPGLSAQ